MLVFTRYPVRLLQSDCLVSPSGIRGIYLLPEYIEKRGVGADAGLRLTPLCVRPETSFNGWVKQFLG
jgi:hypothetical protein